MGKSDGRQRGLSVAAYGEIPMAAVIGGVWAPLDILLVVLPGGGGSARAGWSRPARWQVVIDATNPLEYPGDGSVRLAFGSHDSLGGFSESFPSRWW